MNTHTAQVSCPDALRRHLDRYHTKRHGAVTQVSDPYDYSGEPRLRDVTFQDGARIAFVQGAWDPTSEWMRNEEYWLTHRVQVKGTPPADPDAEVRAALRSRSSKLYDHLLRDHGITGPQVGARMYAEAMSASQQHRDAHGLNPFGTRLVPGHAIDAEGRLVHTDKP